jgi:hypothetical protein
MLDYIEDSGTTLHVRIDHALHDNNYSKVVLARMVLGICGRGLARGAFPTWFCLGDSKVRDHR